MDKLTQFVSKSFENNNNNSVANVEQNAKMRVESPVLDGFIKSENDTTSDTKNSEDDSQKDSKETRQAPVAKNWLISDTPKQSIPTFGIDLRLNNNPNPIYISPTLVNANHNCVNEDPNGQIEPRKHCAGSPSRSKVKWYKSMDTKSPSPKNSYSSSSSPIDLEDSKSCPETLISEKNMGDPITTNVKEDIHSDEKKICEFLTCLAHDLILKKIFIKT